MSRKGMKDDPPATADPSTDPQSQGPHTLVRDYIDYWLTHQVVRPTTLERYRAVMLKRVEPHFGDKKLGDLKKADIQQWVSELRAEGLSPKTIYTYVMTLSSMLGWAVDEDVINFNPCTKVRTPKFDDHGTVIRPLTPDQVLKIANAIRPRQRSLVILMAQTGMRLSEATGLTYDRVDFKNRIISVDRQLVGVTLNQPDFGPPKTRSSVRRLPLSDMAEAAITHQIATYGLGPQGLIFTSARGRPMARTVFGELFRKAAEEVGVDASSHDLRHHCASLLVASGLPVTTVSNFLGHKNPEETLNTYAHLWDYGHAEIREALSEKFTSSVTDAAQMRPRLVS